MNGRDILLSVSAFVIIAIVIVVMLHVLFPGVKGNNDIPNVPDDADDGHHPEPTPNPNPNPNPGTPTGGFMRIVNDTNGYPITVWLDKEKPPCLPDSRGACNPPDGNGNCNGKPYFRVGDNGGRSTCTWQQNDATFFLQQKNGSSVEVPSSQSQQLAPGEAWIIKFPVGIDGRFYWCFDPNMAEQKKGVTNRMCSGSGGWVTRGRTIMENPDGVQRFEFNINTHPDGNGNFIYNMSAVDGINFTFKAEYVSDTCPLGMRYASCPIHLDTDCPENLKFDVVQSKDGRNQIVKTCAAPKIAWLKPEHRPPGFTQEDYNNVSAPGGTLAEKLQYHAFWQNSKWVQPYVNMLRQSQNQCDTYAWAYDEQMCKNGDCTCPLSACESDGQYFSDNPITPLRSCRMDARGYLNISITSVL